ncbi:MAG: hypothetical protein BWY07_02698 [Candidatus Hydrogenedentes bacterium ADurb.Bin170]|nr:MAG: hypothetical protein BWY07_02698 [Candidatus Hydrogenedentes bacterium ADurb.Bin170]
MTAGQGCKDYSTENIPREPIFYKDALSGIRELF